MASRSIFSQAVFLCGRRRVGAFSAPPRPLWSIFTSSFATEATIPPSSVGSAIETLPPPTPIGDNPFAVRKPDTVIATIHGFPTLEPLRFSSFPSTFLHAPLRRDILHRAVIFEGDAHRFGRAKTLTRSEVHGSQAKLWPQKGTGRARIGSKKSPVLRGGGVSHGPKPRDFATKLQKKVYDMAWRVALSYRYRKGQLVVVDGSLEIMENDPDLAKLILEKNGWGKEGKRSLLITRDERPNLEAALDQLHGEGRVLTVEEVDVKDCLELGRIVIEEEALRWFIGKHDYGVN